jgi:hypothetical protein
MAYTTGFVGIFDVIRTFDFGCMSVRGITFPMLGPRVIVIVVARGRNVCPRRPWPLALESTERIGYTTRKGAMSTILRQSASHFIVPYMWLDL